MISEAGSTGDSVTTTIDQIVGHFSELNPVRQEAFLLMVCSLGREDTAFAEAISAFALRSFAPASNAAVEPDYELARRLAGVCVHRTELKAWGRLVADNVMRGDQEGLAAVEDLARRRAAA